MLRTSIEISVIQDDSVRPKRTDVGGTSVALSVRRSFFYGTGLSVHCPALSLKLASLGMKINARSV